MMLRWFADRPVRCVQAAVYLSAGIVFPLHLGWIGASWGEFTVYLVVASLLLSTPVTVLVRPLYHPVWQVVLLVAAPTVLFLAVPAGLSFWLGSTLGPLDEAMDERMCAAQGMVELDSVEADADDSVDVTADCLPGA